ncbi:hypothetical protein [Williamsia sp. 1135]|uniref:hypothetical protein n=1 Tax=Williamsia sp. 1135 TaxID=1889262 RepID=UPI000A0FC9AE|nr:hypothetical protein [Williamsia sp. 1135]ORM36866.1 hypothetical protein BFL43_05735 [Williamsia sp. 1135]
MPHRLTQPGTAIIPTIRCEFHRLRPATTTATRREVGSSIFQVFEGSGEVTLGTQRHSLVTGDLFVVPSWIPWSLHADTQLDLFRFSDAPVVEKLGYPWIDSGRQTRTSH